MPIPKEYALAGNANAHGVVRFAGDTVNIDRLVLSVEKARVDTLQGASLASDAFFPFADGPELAIEAGVTAVIQPGGSVRDHEVVAAADEADVAMVFTKRRHFRH